MSSPNKTFGQLAPLFKIFLILTYGQLHHFLAVSAGSSPVSRVTLRPPHAGVSFSCLWWIRKLPAECEDFHVHTQKLGQTDCVHLRRSLVGVPHPLKRTSFLPGIKKISTEQVFYCVCLFVCLTNTRHLTHQAALCGCPCVVHWSQRCPAL